MDCEISKPKCLCVNYDKKAALTFFIQSYYQCQQVDYSCDLKAEIEAYMPQLIFVQHPPGMAHHRAYGLPANVDCFPEIPRIGFLRNDYYDPGTFSCYQFLRAMKCCACFTTLGLSSAFRYEMEDLPIYSLPIHPFSTELLEEYGNLDDRKIFPLGLIGTGFVPLPIKHYPWRQRVGQEVLNKIPSIIGVRPGKSEPHLGLVGHNYYQAINSCKVAATCGTEVMELLSKHFEIPICRSCLVCEESELARAYGFIDQENCVFATPENVHKKISDIIADEEHLKRVTRAGYEFQLRLSSMDKGYAYLPEFIKLWKKLKPTELIVQPSLFELKIVDGNYRGVRGKRFRGNLLEQLTDNGFEALRENNIVKARECFLTVRQYGEYVPEGVLGLGILELASGNLNTAQNLILSSVNFPGMMYGLSQFFEPVELAYFSVIFCCAGKMAEAEKILTLGEHLRHPALAAAEALLRNSPSLCKEDKNIRSRAPVDDFSSHAWLSHFRSMVRL